MTTVYIDNGVLSTFESTTGANRLEVVNGSLVYFTSGVTNYVILTDSTYITAGTAVTTYQLTAPSGKSTSDFQAGKISDDTNPVPAIDLAADKYTELEFSIEVASGLVANGDEIEFRITDNGSALDSYPLAYIPKITAGSALTFKPFWAMNATRIAI